MESLFTEKVKKSILKRLELLNEHTDAKWGKMNVSQMLSHCKFPLQVALQKLPLDRPNAFKRFIFSFFKASLYNDKPWKQGLPTAPPFIVTDEKEFKKELDELVSTIKEFHDQRDTTEWPEHPMFGKFTSEQWGKMQYKHLDHHLRQFGV
ncbi:DUF1569 domain-containing protein [Psychroserpens sp.]|uniref:DUF1569 domain-containing protein n=1 Tax=Psychroserpens sp. TaxID=2020870 RepID=UPI001B2F14B6|nr:DUF1569 domain-containing protein [Psychroserpens sp.]MBO6606198.1 DUF1569 domain-containing protein [Psychroserpens sp.]MBO6631104.1 DUF1569 domain-containing protein [Psychroserpens sp.]MBO6652430.1 DUF1569 domain-containing protein [Psychroserpens sp.]MBO6681798.1 DUF1569 domain-containing protein [Psychroserpens sp.]MBO6749573.1 DUF1569 domain-containing protein [Psychroserpens sp.]